MSEEEQIGVADDVNSVEHSSLQAADGEALISSLLKTRTMMTEEEEIGVSVEIEPVEQSWLHLPDLMKEFEYEDFMNLGSSYDNKAHEIDEGDNGSVDEVEAIVPQCGMIFDTADEAYNFYNGYVRKIGFSVRKQMTNKSKADQNKILRQLLVCSCEGTYKKIRTPRKKLLVDFKLTDNVWLQRLYEFREKWAQVYSHAYFCVGMTTTQRSESINNFLKKYFGSTLVLREFVDQYAKAIASRREKEREAENKTQQTSPILVSKWSVVCEAAEKYMKKVFYLFQREFQQALDLSLNLENDDDTISTYIVKELEGWKKIRKLVHNPLEHSVSCTCQKFEFHGILCSHALKLFRHLQYESFLFGLLLIAILGTVALAFWIASCCITC